MKRFMTMIAILSVLVLASSAMANQYGWTISASNQSPTVNTASATFGLATYYLWFACSDVDGMSAAEFDIASAGVVHLATIVQNGFLNAGGTANLLLAVGGCPIGPVVAANLLAMSFPGTMCIVASAANNINGTVDCQPAPSLWANQTIGLSVSGVPACPGDWQGTLCPPISVQESSWGSIKGLYR